ncbi:hypothetical protein M9434_003744 [Picochlorum sp. BPE23]|nr:hypothetical protein M9434_003744 [Picochlorum sp. BPE23]KAI8113317.1 hypothetical protein M9435_003321 [Picochlorum sp. BPE23]
MSSAAALFDRQQLKSREDMLALGQILNDTMQEYIEREGNKYDPVTIEKMEASTVEVFRQIKQFVGYNEEEEGGIGGDGFGSPQLPPLSPPPCDPEVDALEEKVRVASERIAKLRADMQQAVQETVQKKILEKLPTATEDSEDDRPHEDAAAAALSDGVDAEALKDKLAHASARMPELRAKLEDVYGKLNKLLDSMDEKTEVTTEPPNTAERAMKRLYGEEKNDDAELTQDISLAP